MTLGMVMVDIAQAGVIRVPLERQGAEFDTPIWLPWTDDLTEQLPFPPPPAKKRSSTSKSKSKTLKGPGPASVWMVPAKQVVNAISILHQDQWAEFHYIIQNDVLYIRVGIFLLPDYELRGDRTYSHLTQAKKTMLLLLRAWEWEDVAAMDWSDGVIPPLVMIDKDPRTLSEIYQSLPSPRISNRDRERLDRAGLRIIEELDNMDGVTMRKYSDHTKRLQFQLNSVKKMLLQERAPAYMMDLAWSQILEQGRPEARRYWLNVVDWRATRTDQGIDRMPLPSGGLLCEEMGVGKTLISLSLILATSHHFPTPPSSICSSDVLTIHALETFPFASWEEHRQRLSIPYKQHHTDGSPRLGPPKLSKLAEVIFLRKPMYTRQGERDFPGTRKEDDLKRIKPFYFAQDGGEVGGIAHGHELRGGRSVDAYGFDDTAVKWKKRYITGCTLVVVPALLMAQWLKQIAEHFEPGTFRIEVVENKRNRKIPKPKRMVKADILLFAKEAFTREDEMRSPLFDYHFKRVMFDEGHFGAQGMAGKILRLAKKLVSESRWVITGTPATHLIGDRGALPNLQAPDEVDQTFEDPDGSPVVKSEFESSIHEEEEWNLHIKYEADATPMVVKEEEDVKPDIQLSVKNEPDDDDDLDYDGPVSANAWSDDDVKDLDQIAKLYTDFLYTPLMNSFNISIKRAAKDRRGPQVNVVAKLASLLQRVLIRNQASTVLAEQDLPPFKSHRVGFELSHIGMLTYNFMQAVVARNVITAANRTSISKKMSDSKGNFFQIMANLRDSSVWYTGGNMYAENVIKALRGILAGLEARIASGTASIIERQQDLEILKAAIDHVNLATSDPSWSQIMHCNSLPLEIIDGTLPNDIAEAWSMCSNSAGIDATSTMDRDGVSIIADHYLRMRDKMTASNIISFEDGLVELIEQANTWRHKEEAIQASEVAEKMNRFRKPAGDRKPKAKAKAKTAGETSLAKSDAAVLRQHKKRLKEQMGGDIDDEIEVIDIEEDTPEVTESSSSPVLFTTLSSKISWVVKEISRCPDDVFVVFSHSTNSLAYLREALEVANIHICHVSFDGGSVEVRQANVESFQMGVYRVCLMDIRVAARGLNLAMANRMIFLEPVWQKDVEAQAQKRIHRIGQKRVTTSHTLYLKGTFEEARLRRRDETDKQNEYDDAQMHDLIRYPRFYDRQVITPTIIPTSATGSPVSPTLLSSASLAADPSTNAIFDGPFKAVNKNAISARERARFMFAAPAQTFLAEGKPSVDEPKVSPGRKRVRMRFSDEDEDSSGEGSTPGPKRVRIFE